MQLAKSGGAESEQQRVNSEATDFKLSYESVLGKDKFGEWIVALKGMKELPKYEDKTKEWMQLIEREMEGKKEAMEKELAEAKAKLEEAKAKDEGKGTIEQERVDNLQKLVPFVLLKLYYEDGAGGEGDKWLFPWDMPENGKIWSPDAGPEEKGDWLPVQGYEPKLEGIKKDVKKFTDSYFDPGQQPDEAEDWAKEYPNTFTYYEEQDKISVTLEDYLNKHRLPNTAEVTDMQARWRGRPEAHGKPFDPSFYGLLSRAGLEGYEEHPYLKIFKWLEQRTDDVNGTRYQMGKVKQAEKQKTAGEPAVVLALPVVYGDIEGQGWSVAPDEHVDQEIEDRRAQEIEDRRAQEIADRRAKETADNAKLSKQNEEAKRKAKEDEEKQREAEAAAKAEEEERIKKEKLEAELKATQVKKQWFEDLKSALEGEGWRLGINFTEEGIISYLSAAADKANPATIALNEILGKGRAI